MKILLTGDSWAAGDWNDNWNRNTKTNAVSNYIFSPVLVELLENDGHSVIHCPHPAASDLPSLYSVREHYSKVDFIIFFKTQCSRLMNYYSSERIYNIFKGEDWPSFDNYKKNNFLGIDQNIIDEMLQLNFISIEGLFANYAKKNLSLNEIFFQINQELVYKELFKYKNKLLLIGGLESIQTKYQFDYTIDDLVNFLTKTKNINFTLCSSEKFVEIHKFIFNSNLKLKQKNNLIADLLKLQENNDDLEINFANSPNFFGPVDKVHPNKNAINLYYYKLIKPILEEIENDYRTTV